MSFHPLSTVPSLFSLLFLPFVLLAVLLPCTFSLPVTIINNSPRYDVNGTLINAHDGGIYLFEGLYHLYGTQYAHCHQHSVTCNGQCGYYAYKQISQTQRRIWCLVLTIQPALEQILQQQKEHLLSSPTALREEFINVSSVRQEMRYMMEEVNSTLIRCSKALEEGHAPGEGRVDKVIRGVMGIEKKFATDLSRMSARVKEGKGRMLSSRAIVPIAVFLYSAAQLAEQFLIFNAAVTRLLELERPAAYDD